jgi:hypothetical protein
VLHTYHVAFYFVLRDSYIEDQIADSSERVAAPVYLTRQAAGINIFQSVRLKLYNIQNETI